MITDEYAAGFFDGEGHLHISNNHGAGLKYRYHTLVVSVGQNDPRPLRELQETYGGAIHKNITSSGKQYGQWVLNNHRAASFLEKVLPHLIVKRAQALEAVEFVKLLRIGSKRLTEEDLVLREGFRQRIHTLKQTEDKWD